MAKKKFESGLGRGLNALLGDPEIQTGGEGSVTLKDKEGKTFSVKADSVILSVGYKSAPVAPKGKHVHVIGDAEKVGNLRSVIWGAWDVCMKL